MFAPFYRAVVGAASERSHHPISVVANAKGRLKSWMTMMMRAKGLSGGPSREAR